MFSRSTEASLASIASSSANSARRSLKRLCVKRKIVSLCQSVSSASIPMIESGMARLISSWRSLRNAGGAGRRQADPERLRPGVGTLADMPEDAGGIDEIGDHAAPRLQLWRRRRPHAEPAGQIERLDIAEPGVEVAHAP